MRWLPVAFLLLLSSAFAQSSPRDWHISTSQWLSIDETLRTLEEQTIDMQTLLDEQNRQLANLENAYLDTRLLYNNSESRYRQLEQDMSRCKTSLKVWRIVGLSAIAALVGVTIYASIR